MIPPVVGASWLEAHPEAVLADVRWYLDGRSGRAAYEAGHMPGAVFVELEEWLAAPTSPDEGRHPFPEPEVFARGMGSLGIGDGDAVVAYDDEGGVIAARLVWMLRVTGHDAALLDGGLQGPLERTSVAREPARFTARPWPADRFASMDDAADPAGVAIDARQRERFEGREANPVDPRSGHIPGARSVPVREHLGTDGRLLPDEALRERLAAAGVVPGASVVSYCGSGVTACHNLLVMEHLALGPGRLYPGSWSQWSRTNRAAATGAD